ncbi:Hypothetical predicted protein [Cloeon dipterum]|uniref:USP domain-containing protein n=1 Tax=Cloeon dipterum TaxID=197152 RepID=A0A8S1D6N7_9INSE|nr:Hypothetical predicted protein [Cloeon dipterum]
MPLEKFIQYSGWGICAFCKLYKHCYSLLLLTTLPLCEGCIDNEPISDPEFCPGFFTYLQSLTPLCAITNDVVEKNGKMCCLCNEAKGTVPVSNLDILQPTLDLYNDKMVKFEPGDFLCSNCSRIRGSKETEEVPIMDVEPAAAVAEPNEGEIDFSLRVPQQPCHEPGNE